MKLTFIFMILDTLVLLIYPFLYIIHTIRKMIGVK